MVYFTGELVLVFTLGLVIPVSHTQTTCDVSHENEKALSPGDSLQIFCQTSSGHSTVWTGSLLNQQCPGNEIILRHNIFPEIRLVCGDAVGEGLSVVNNSVYSSQLSVNISCGFNDTFVTCQFDDGMTTDVCNYHVIIHEPSSPDNVRITNISSDGLTFSWSHNTSSTSLVAFSYSINSSGCGTCPTATTSTTATCYDVTFNSLQSCIFRVQTSICSSSRSATFNATFRDLISVPVLNSIIPTYSQQSLNLVSIHVEFQAMDSQSISPEVNITNTSYNLTYTKVTSGELCRLKTVDPIQYFNKFYQDIFEVMSPCLSADIVVTLSALNNLGITTASIPVHIAATNRFVMVTYDSVVKNLRCIFLNKGDRSKKICFVTYGPCGLNETKNSTGTFNILYPSTVEVQLSLLDQDRNHYCYTVTTSNDTFSVVVDGNFTLNKNDSNSDGLNGGEIAAITVTLVLLVTIIMTVAVIIILYYYSKDKTSPERANPNDTTSELLQSKLNEGTQNTIELQTVHLEPASKDNFEMYKVKEPTGLRQFLENEIPKINFTRSIAFYEFTNPTEDIEINCKVILIEKETGKYFSGPNAYSIACTSVKKKISDTRFEVNRPSNDKYRVFICDDGPGSRHLAKGSSLLVQVDIKSGPGSNTPRSLGLKEVPTGHFKKLEVKQECQLYSLIKNEYKLDYWRGCAFYEFSHDTEDVSDDKEVLLFDVNNDKLYTGEKAKVIIGVPGVGIRNKKDRNIWRVFVQSKCTGNRHLDGGTELYYQLYDDKSKTPCTYKRGDKTHKNNENVDNYLGPDTSGELKLLQVHEICSLSNFIAGHPETSGYERKCAYYEFLHDNEDIRGKEIILMDTKGTLHVGGGAYMKLLSENNSNIESDVKKPELPGYPKVFIQCTGPGNIYLKAGSSVIYKDPKIDNFEPVDVNVYHKFKVTTTCELRRFVEDKVGNFKRGAAFYQFTCEEEDISKDKEVLLLSKDGNAIYTGAAACHKIGAPGKGISRPPDDFEYTVFVQNKSRGSRCLLEGTLLLYKKDFEGEIEEPVSP